MVQILAVHDLASAQTRSLKHRDELLQTAATIDPLLSRFGGGPRGIGVAHALWYLPYYRHRARRKPSVASRRELLDAGGPARKPIEQTGTRTN